MLAPGLSVCSKWAPTGARQTYSNAFRCFQGSQTRKCVVSVFLGAAWWSCLVSCKHAGSRFSFLVCAYLQQQRHPHHSQDVRLLPFAHYCTAAWKPFASCFIAVPRDWLAVCVCVYVRARVYHLLSVCTSLRCPPCLPQKCLLAACYLLPATCCCCSSSHTLPLRCSSTRRLSTRSLLHPASHIPDSRVGCPHPIHPSIQTLAPSALSTHQSLPCLLCLCFAQLPSRGALPTSPLLSRGTRRQAIPCAAPGNYTRTTCGTCRPRGDRAPWTG